MATKKKTVNKAAWIRTQPTDLPAKELVSRAKKAGFAITEAQVYTTRSDMKKKGGGSALKPTRTSGGGGSLDVMVRAIVREEIKAFFASR